MGKCLGCQYYDYENAKAWCKLLNTDAKVGTKCPLYCKLKEPWTIKQLAS